MENTPEKTSTAWEGPWPEVAVLAIAFGTYAASCVNGPVNWPVSWPLGQALCPALGYWGTVAVNAAAAGLLGGAVAWVVYRLFRPAPRARR
jgi:hypothetical protein